MTGHLALVIAVLFWGGSFVAARHILSPNDGGPHLSPILLATARFALASLVFAPVVAWGIWRRKIGWRAGLGLALLGQVMFPIYFWLQYVGVERTGAGLSAILVIGLTPAMTALMGHLLGTEKWTWGQAVALILGALGLVLLVQPQIGTAKAGFLVGALCCVANAAIYAVNSHVVKRWMKDGISPLLMTAWTMTAGTIGSILWCLLVPDPTFADLGKLSASQAVSLGYLALFCSVIAFFAYNFGLTRIDAGRASVYLYAEPIIAVGLGIALLGERPQWRDLPGTAAIVISVILVNRRKKQEA